MSLLPPSTDLFQSDIDLLHCYIPTLLMTFGTKCETSSANTILPVIMSLNVGTFLMEAFSAAAAGLIKCTRILCIILVVLECTRLSG